MTGTCEACGKRGPINRHHWDYTRDDDLIPLCHKCHSGVHCGKIAEPRTGRVYRVREVRSIRGIRTTKRAWRLIEDEAARQSVSPVRISACSVAAILIEQALTQAESARAARVTP